MAATVAKAVFTLNSRYDAVFNIRAAIRAALTPPFSPVALICPPDLLVEDVDARVEAVAAPSLAALSAAQAMQFARVLAGARRPAFIAGEDVHWTHASRELEHWRRRSRSVYVAPYTGVLPVSSASPWYAGYLPPSRKQIAARLAGHDAVFFVGGRGLRTTLVQRGAADAEQALDRHRPRGARLRRRVQRRQRRGRRWRALADPESDADRRRGARGDDQDLAAAHRRAAPRCDDLHPSRVVRALLETFADAIWFDESGLSTSDVRQWMTLAAGEYFINGSGGIGWGLAASVGAAIAHPQRQVVAIVGDGSALYASEALWTAAHRRTHLLVVVLANGRYATLNEAAGRLAGHPLKAFSIEPPRLDFSGLATLYGWKYHAIASEAELSRFLGQSGRTITANTLVEIALDPAVKPVMASRHF